MGSAVGKGKIGKRRTGKMSQGMANGKRIGTRGSGIGQGKGGCGTGLEAGRGVGFFCAQNIWDKEPEFGDTSVWQSIRRHMGKVMARRCR
jgi:hypothetical protein